MRRRATFQPQPMPEDQSLRIAVLEQSFNDIAVVLDDFRRDMVEPPATASSPGRPGQLAYDSSFLYVCIDVDTWKRTALSTW